MYMISTFMIDVNRYDKIVSTKFHLITLPKIKFSFLLPTIEDWLKRMASLTLQIFCLIATGLLTGHGLTPLLATSPGGCLYRGQYYPLGSFQASPCDHCQCTFSGQAYCSPVNCFFGECVDQVYDKNHCCPVCPNGKTLLLMLNLRTNGVPDYTTVFLFFTFCYYIWIWTLKENTVSCR